MSSHKDKITKLAQTLEEWDYKVDRLEHRIKDLPDELKALAEKKYQKLLAFRDSVKEKETELINASEYAVEVIEYSIDEAIDTFKLLFGDVEVHSKIEGL
ncbi:MAG: archaellum component FlaC [Oleiphilaceae bacterium]|jgi:archaellum component FlaC